MNRHPHTLKAAWVTAITTVIPTTSLPNPAVFLCISSFGENVPKAAQVGEDGIFPCQGDRPLQSQEKPGVLFVEGPRTLDYFSPLPCLGPLFWGGVVLSAQTVGEGSLVYLGEQKEPCQCACIGWPGEGTMLREGVGSPGLGSMENAVPPAVLRLICT